MDQGNSDSNLLSYCHMMDCAEMTGYDNPNFLHRRNYHFKDVNAKRFRSCGDIKRDQVPRCYDHRNKIRTKKMRSNDEEIFDKNESSSGESERLNGNRRRIQGQSHLGRFNERLSTSGEFYERSSIDDRRRGERSTYGQHVLEHPDYDEESGQASGSDTGQRSEFGSDADANQMHGSYLNYGADELSDDGGKFSEYELGSNIRFRKDNMFGKQRQNVENPCVAECKFLDDGLAAYVEVRVDDRHDLPSDASDSKSVKNVSFDYLDSHKRRITRPSIGSLSQCSTVRQMKSEMLRQIAEITRDDVDTGDELLPNFRRKCWARRCWSRDYHSHRVAFSRLKLQNAPVKHASGSASWRLSARKSNRKFKESLKEFKSKFNLWHSSLKAIEGHFGTGVVSYFVFIRWLLFLNCFIFSLIFIFIILPTLIFTKVPLYAVDVNAVPAGNNVTATSPLNANDTGSRIPDWYSTYVNATSKYRRNVRNMTQVSAKARIQDLLQGTGWMELTVMFYGAFEPNNLFIGRFSGQDHWYFLPASYMVVTVVYFFFSMIFMVKSMVKGSRETLVINEGQFYRYFNIVFGSWDFCITDNNAAELKQMGIYMEIQTNLKEDEFNALKNERSNLMKFGLYTVRLIVNLISLAILVGAGYLIYYVTIQSVEIREKNEGKLSKIVELLLEFLTPLTITLLYLALPSLFRALVALEKYRLQFALNITLFRTVFVRLASLAVLMSTFSQQITCDKDDPDCVKLACWETYVGQQLYKLVIVDFMVVVLATFFMELPRRLIVTKFSYKIFSLIGKPEFNVTMNVLDLVYSQTLCWLGCFYCPLLPAISIIKFLSYFYIKKFTLLHNCKPSTLAYKASRSNTFFMVVLFLAFLFCCIPLIYSVSEITPSRGCGPFRLNDDIWQVVSSSVHQWPNILSQIMSIVCTPVFATPVFIILCLTMYYYYMITLAHKQMVSVLKEQLKEEGIDKQYLLARLTQQTRLTT
ncbi:TMC7 (predicted) [Pycnogonum litorale]